MQLFIFIVLIFVNPFYCGYFIDNEQDQKLIEETTNILTTSIGELDIIDIESFRELNTNLDKTYSKEELDLLSNVISTLLEQINKGMSTIYYRGKLRDMDLYILYRYFQNYKYLIDYTGCSVSMINYSDSANNCGIYEYSFTVSFE